jgi:hypothetical protein
MPPADDVLWRRQSRKKENHERRRARERRWAHLSYLPTYVPTSQQDLPTYHPAWRTWDIHRMVVGQESAFSIQVPVHYLTTNHGRNLSCSVFTTYLSTYHPPLPTCSTSRKAN